MNSFTKEPLHIADVVVYLKNERTGSSTVRKCKFVGQIADFTDVKVKIRRLSPPDTFITAEESKDFGIDTVYPEDVIHIIISKYQDDSYVRTLNALSKVIDDKNKDIKMLIGDWFCALEDEGFDPWMREECVEIANKHLYTKEDYIKFLNSLIGK